MICVALSLTLTLSRWEREQPLAAPVNFSAIEQKPVVDLPGRGERFSLSQRERVGVRENGLVSLRGLSILLRRLNSLSETHRPDACATKT